MCRPCSYLGQHCIEQIAKGEDTSLRKFWKATLFLHMSPGSVCVWGGGGGGVKTTTKSPL